MKYRKKQQDSSNQDGKDEDAKNQTIVEKIENVQIKEKGASHDLKSDHSMKDESNQSHHKQQKDHKKGKKFQPKKQIEEGKQEEDSSMNDQNQECFRPKKLNVEKLPLIHVNRKLNTVPSTELGFTGDSSLWFDEEAYR